MTRTTSHGVSIVGVLGALAAMLVVRPAAASDGYPALVQSDLHLAQAPACTVCHAGPSVESVPDMTAFGLSVRAFGATADNPTTFEAAFSLIRSTRWDSDGDGVPDADELVAGTDPNDGPLRAGTTGPDHGCSLAHPGTVSSHAHERGLARLFWLAAIAIVTRARRRAIRAFPTCCPSGRALKPRRP